MDNEGHRLARFLIDQALSPALAVWLRSEDGGGHTAAHVRELGLSRATDEQLFSRALAESSILITSDLDFPRILALRGESGPGLILFRAGNISDTDMLALLRRVLLEVPLDVLQTSVVVIDESAIRVRRLPLRGSE